MKSIVAAAAAPALPAGAVTSPIQLHVDLDVDPAKQKEMLGNFHRVFQPTISKQPGFVEVKLLHLRSTLAGPAPGTASYRLLISFQTEDQRKAWVATAEHQKVWPTIEKTLRGNPAVILYDVV